MKGRIGFIVFAIALLFACKSKQPAKENTPEKAAGISAQGTVTHKYANEGCATIIVCPQKEDTLFLIPVTPLGKFDSDGSKIKFSYRIMRVHNPKGCKQGIPAEISDVKKLK